MTTHLINHGRPYVRSVHYIPCAMETESVAIIYLSLGEVFVAKENPDIVYAGASSN